MENKNLHSYTVLSGIALFIISLFLYRLVLPYGDEPDFFTRYYQISTYDHSWFSPYNFLFDSLSTILPPSNCQIVATPFSIVATIDYSSCAEPLSMSVYRFITSLWVFTPLLLISLFLGCVRSSQRAVALVLSMLVPGAIYYSGVLSFEQLSLMFSLLCFIYWKQRIIVFSLIAIVFFIDFGNAIVVLTFYGMALFYEALYKKHGFQTVFYVSMFQLAVLFILGHRVLAYTSEIAFLADKSNAMGEVLDKSDLIDKYPVILRPVITYMTLIFFTPSYIKTPILYALFGVVIFIGVKRLRYFFHYANEVDRRDVLTTFTAIICALSFIFMFPNYSNAKYYVFLLPFIMLSFLKVFGMSKILFFLFASNLLVFMNLIYFSM